MTNKKIRKSVTLNKEIDNYLKNKSKKLCISQSALISVILYEHMKNDDFIKKLK